MSPRRFASSILRSIEPRYSSVVASAMAVFTIVPASRRLLHLGKELAGVALVVGSGYSRPAHDLGISTGAHDRLDVVVPDGAEGDDAVASDLRQVPWSSRSRIQCRPTDADQTSSCGEITKRLTVSWPPS